LTGITEPKGCGHDRQSSRQTSSAAQRLNKSGSAALDKNTNNTATKNKPPVLTGKFLFIKEIVAPQQIKLQKSMVVHITAMLKTHANISKCTQTSARFASKYIDKLDVDKANKP